MAKAAATEKYVLLPAQGLRAKGRGGSPGHDFLTSIGSAQGKGELSLESGRINVNVLDSIGPDGAKLLELTPDAALAIRARQPGLRLVPVVYYTPAVAPPMQIQERHEAAAGAGTVSMQVVSTGKQPVAGAFVVAFTNFAARAGAQGVTDANGQVQLALAGAGPKLERVYVYPVTPHWSLLKKKVTLAPTMVLTIAPLDMGYTDGLRHFYGNPDLTVGTGVTVAVVDTGVANHPDLVIAGGANTVPGEDPKDYGDNGQHHGTHVAGIIAARGQAPTGLRGVAPGVSLRAYRVFGQGSGSASSFAIAKAIDLAVTDKCDLINMSLGGGQPDPTLTAAVEDVRAKGSLCIIAAGNGDRAPVSFPANDSMVIAVSALGRKGTFPASSAEADDIAAPYGTDKADFIASFSNVGPEVDLTGPGVGIMSTFPNGYAEISGTSMACPAVTGAAARALAASAVLKTKRDATRSAGIVSALLASAHTLGFQSQFEGHGLAAPQ